MFGIVCVFFVEGAVYSTCLVATHSNGNLVSWMGSD